MSNSIMKVHNFENFKKIAKKIKFALTKIQRDQILQKSEKNLRHNLMLRLAFSTGARIGEIIHCLYSDFNFVTNTFHIQPHKGSKYYSSHNLKTPFSERIVPVDPDLLKEIKSYADSRKLTYVFGKIIKSGKNKGKFAHFSRNASINFINKYAQECSTLGIDIGFHATRRTYASFLSSEGVSLSSISQLLGHASIATTIIYLSQIKILDFTEIQKIITNM